MINCCALLQLLLGNMGRPGGGIMALRGHASIQGSTDVPTLYHSIHGYMSAPSTLKSHDTLHDYLATETQPTGYWANTPKFMVSYLKSMYGDAARPENDYGYGWHAKIFGDFSHIAMMSAMIEGKVRGMIAVGQNPATSLNASAQRAAMRKLDWLVVKDNWLTETAEQWKNGPEITDGSVKVGRHQDRGVLLSGYAGGRIQRQLHEYAAHAAVALQGGRAAGRLSHGHVVLLPARQTTEKEIREQHEPARRGMAKARVGLRARCDIGRGSRCEG